MALIADSGAVYALYDVADRHHNAVVRVLDEEPGLIYLPVALVAELDYLLREFLGIDAELSFLEDLAEGAYSLEPFLEEDLKRCRELIAKYRNLDLGLADASVMATAERLEVYRILTVDERDFRAVRSKSGQPFLLLPADARG